MPEKEWVDFTRNVNGPKLKWLEHKLRQAGIRFRFHGMSPVGPVVQVAPEQIVDALEFYTAPIAQSLIGAHHPNLTWADLNDNHELFGDIITAPFPEQLQPTKTSPALPSDITDFPDAVGITMYQVSSSNLSRIGYDDQSMLAPAGMLYVQFKGGTIYRYWGVEKKIWDVLVQQAEQAERGVQEASVGSHYHHLVRVPADEGKKICQRLDNGVWSNVPPKAVRQAMRKGQNNDRT